jgi:hypothetical protein
MQRCLSQKMAHHKAPEKKMPSAAKALADCMMYDV